MTDTAYVAFFGDSERRFVLTPPLVIELERVTASGIGGLYRRFASLDFRHGELLAVIRLGLIGGGETPASAAALTEAYAVRRPVMEVFPVAIGTLDMLMTGKVTTDDE